MHSTMLLLIKRENVHGNDQENDIEYYATDGIYSKKNSNDDSSNIEGYEGDINNNLAIIHRIMHVFVS